MGEASSLLALASLPSQTARMEDWIGLLRRSFRHINKGTIMLYLGILKFWWHLRWWIMVFTRYLFMMWVASVSNQIMFLLVKLGVRQDESQDVRERRWSRRWQVRNLGAKEWSVKEKDLFL